jgi:hypothetical protein
MNAGTRLFDGANHPRSDAFRDPSSSKGSDLPTSWEDLVGRARASDLYPSAGAQLLLQSPCRRAKQLFSRLIRCVF